MTGVRPRLGTVEEWTLINNSTSEHPFHIHINDFQVMSINGHPYNAHGLQDTVVIPAKGGRVVIRQPYEDFTGKFVFHCHVIFHEDRGMMAVVQVLKNPKPSDVAKNQAMYLHPPDESHAQYASVPPDGRLRQLLFYCRLLARNET